MVIYMQTTASTISIPKDMDLKIRELASERGQTKNGLIQEALRYYLARLELEDVERKMQAKARALGITSDDDVVDMIHQARKKEKN